MKGHRIQVEIGSGAMIYITSFMKIGSGIQAPIWGEGEGYTDTDTQRARRLHKLTLRKWLKMACDTNNA
jgi:hypothetical protein